MIIKYKVIVLFLFCGVLLRSEAGTAATVVPLANGLTVIVHDAKEIRQDLRVEEAGRRFLVHPLVGRLELMTGPGDARLLRTPVDTFWTCSAEDAVTALDDVRGITPHLEVHVFILPAPPVSEQCSFARENVILLAPGFAPVPTTTLAYILTHELGHVLTWAYLDGVPARWSAYLALRGLQDCRWQTSGAHADLSREILAEDIRYLFGGPAAGSSGTIENHDLVLPDRVSGLRELLQDFLTGDPLLSAAALLCVASPNPCNPAATIQVRLPAGWAPLAPPGSPEIRIFDVRGRQVRRLDARTPGSDGLSARWDGCDEAGRQVSSGPYLYSVAWGGLHARGTVTVIR